MVSGLRASDNSAGASRVLYLYIQTCGLCLIAPSLPLYSQTPVSLNCRLCDLDAARRYAAETSGNADDFLYTPIAGNPKPWTLPSPLEPARTSLLAANWITQTGIGLWPQAPSQPAQPEAGQNKTDQKNTEQKKKEQYSPTATTDSPGHIFWVIPAFRVDYGKGFQPLSPKEKFQEWARGSYDPLGLGWGAFEAGTLEYSSSDGFCGYGHGFKNFGKCYGALELDANNSSFIGDFLLPVLLHQDPRYFRLGEGSFLHRVGYAVVRVFMTYNDSGHTVVYTSALAGTVIASALSNLYYPSKEVNASHTMTRIAIDLGNTALYNAAAEFWPEIHQMVRHIF